MPSEELSRDTRPSLQFLPSAKSEGFASSVIASVNDTNPNIIVRELIQNSFDATMQRRLDRCHVDFVFDRMPVDEIPGIKEYRQAFQSAKKAHRRNLETVAAQIERIESQLDEQEIEVLNVFDNGIGLNSQRLHALLGDGMTDKVGRNAQSGGSYGVGHYTVFPASDLQYILYAGLTEDNKRIMSGHAMLASHPPPPYWKKV